MRVITSSADAEQAQLDAVRASGSATTAAGRAELLELAQKGNRHAADALRAFAGFSEGRQRLEAAAAAGEVVALQVLAEFGQPAKAGAR
ncbi:MAG: hypothetical protein ACK4N5_22495 [Myxococcales bacterium]